MLYRSISPPETWLDARAQSVERWLCIDFGLWSALLCTAVYAACVVIFLWPGVFFCAVFLNDAFIYVDAGYRLTFGQAPGVDTTSALGAFAFVPYAIAFEVNRNAIEAIPLSFAIFGGIVLVLAGLIALARLSALIGVVVVVTCALAMLAPFVIGHEVSGEVMTSAAMSYNRFGFLLILLAALLTIKPRWPRSRVWRSVDLLWAVTATTLAYYTKMPFGLGVAGLVGLWLAVFRRDWRAALVFVAGCSFAAAAFEAMWPGLNAAYIHEMKFAAQANGGALFGATVFGAMAHTMPETLSIALAPFAAMVLVGRADWRDAVLVALLLCGSFLLLSQSSQGMVLVTPVAVAVIAATRLATADATEPQRVALWISLTAVAAGFGLLAVPAAAAFVRHARYAAHAPPIPGMPVNYRSLRVIDDSDIAGLDAAFTGSLSAAQGFAAARTRDQRFTLNALRENEYAHTVAELAQARELCGPERNRTAVLDFANVSASLFGHPPSGHWSYLHWGRSFSATAFVPPGHLFAGVGCAFDPKLPQNPGAHDGIWTVYGAYLRAHFRLAGETPFWRVLVVQPANNSSAPGPGNAR